MTESNFVMVLGAVIAAGIFLWGLSGVFTGRIRVKSYGSADDGSRRFSRIVSRIEQPRWFWTICCLYMALGIALLIGIAMVLSVEPSLS